jgi:hypothetical protein
VPHAWSEPIFVRAPRLRDQRAPILKGVRAINVLSSVPYAGAASMRDAGWLRWTSRAAKVSG